MVLRLRWLCYVACSKRWTPVWKTARVVTPRALTRHRALIAALRHMRYCLRRFDIRGKDRGWSHRLCILWLQPYTAKTTVYCNISAFDLLIYGQRTVIQCIALKNQCIIVLRPIHVCIIIIVNGSAFVCGICLRETSLLCIVSNLKRCTMCIYM